MGNNFFLIFINFRGCDNNIPILFISASRECKYSILFFNFHMKKNIAKDLYLKI